MKSNKKLKAEMFRIIDRWASSEMNQKVFCRLEGINYYKFKYWKTQYTREQKPPYTQQSDFIPIELPYAQESLSGLELVFPNGIKLTCTQSISANQLSELIKLF